VLARCSPLPERLVSDDGPFVDRRDVWRTGEGGTIGRVKKNVERCLLPVDSAD
jgi:hypothetical protein